MTKIIDLRVDKKLINSNFEKYQFCSDNILNTREIKLQNEILRLELNSSQNSWLEARLFAFHNHLFRNPYDSSCLFIDKNGEIWKFQDNGSLELFYKSKSINLNSSKCIYNPSIAFASKETLVFCDGGGTLEILFENNGTIKHFLFDDVESAVILDARLNKESSSIVIALYTVDENKGKRFSRLVLLSYKCTENHEDSSQTLKLIKKQTLKVKGAIEHVYIEENGNICHVISQEQIEFESDSANPVQANDKVLPADSQIKIPKYCWSQNDESITVYVKVPEKYANVTAKVETTPTSILITVDETILLGGQTPSRLESELTTWKRKDDTLEVDLSKHENGLMWSELIKGDTGGEYLPNEALAAEIHSRLSHLCSDQQELNSEDQPAIGFNSEQLEECDLSGTKHFLQRINLNNHSVTHMTMLSSSNRVLFAEKHSFGQVLCLRHDHDGCVWIIKDSVNDDWNLEHVHTFPGFGYVEASKTNKKFCISPADGSYIVIIEHARNAFLYEKPESNARIGKQRILDFGSELSPTLGVTIINKYLIILTKDALYQLQLYS